MNRVKDEIKQHMLTNNYLRKKNLEDLIFKG